MVNLNADVIFSKILESYDIESTQDLLDLINDAIMNLDPSLTESQSIDLASNL